MVVRGERGPVLFVIAALVSLLHGFDDSQTDAWEPFLSDDV